jgi:hypothetical protein
MVIRSEVVSEKPVLQGACSEQLCCWSCIVYSLSSDNGEHVVSDGLLQLCSPYKIVFHLFGKLSYKLSPHMVICPVVGCLLLGIELRVCLILLLSAAAAVYGLKFMIRSTSYLL